MKSFDFGKLAQQKQRVIKRNAVISFLLLVLYAACLSLVLIFSTYEKRALFMAIGSSALTVIMLCLVYFFFIGVLVLRKELRKIEYILNGYIDEAEGVVKSIGPSLTLSNGRNVIEIVLENENGTIVSYFDKEFGAIPFVVGATYRVKLSSGIIVEAEGEFNE